MTGEPERRGGVLELWGDRVDWTKDCMWGQRQQKSHGTISRCDALGQGAQKEKQVGGESRRMSPEWVEFSWGAWGHLWTSLGGAAFTSSLGAQGRAQLGEGGWA